MGHAQAIPAGEITMGNRFTASDTCQLDLNNFDLPNAVKLEGAATVKNAGGKAATLSGSITAGTFRQRVAADNGSSLKVSGAIKCSEFLIIGSDKGAPLAKANLVELAPASPNTAKRVQVERGAVLRAIDGMGLPSEARLVLAAGVFESRGEFNRPLVSLKGGTDGQGGISFCWDSYAGTGFSAQGGPLTVRLQGANPLVWGTQADGSTTKPGNYHLVLNSPTADSVLTFDVPLDFAGEGVGSKRGLHPLHRISVQAGEAVLPQSINNSGNKTAAILKLGAGLLTLNAANSYNDQTLVREGGVAFGSPASIGGQGRSVLPENGTVVAANFPIDNAFLQRLASPSTMAFTVALGADSAAPLDFNSNSGAVLRAASLGATQEATCSGVLTPATKCSALAVAEESWSSPTRRMFLPSLADRSPPEVLCFPKAPSCRRILCSSMDRS
jgi:autotransporter-associated beta strand protein